MKEAGKRLRGGNPKEPKNDLINIPRVLSRQGKKDLFFLFQCFALCVSLLYLCGMSGKSCCPFYHSYDTRGWAEKYAFLSSAQNQLGEIPWRQMSFQTWPSYQAPYSRPLASVIHTLCMRQLNRIEHLISIHVTDISTKEINVWNLLWACVSCVLCLMLCTVQ